HSPAVQPQTKIVQLHVESARIQRFRRACRLLLTPLGFCFLRQLSDGAFHSGEDLAATVGLTRARVSQLLKQAEPAGLALDGVRGRGYRLLAPPDFLDPPAIRSALEEFGCDVAPADAKAP